MSSYPLLLATVGGAGLELAAIVPDALLGNGRITQARVEPEGERGGGFGAGHHTIVPVARKRETMWCPLHPMPKERAQSGESGHRILQGPTVRAFTSIYARNELIRARFTHQTQAGFLITACVMLGVLLSNLGRRNR